MSDSIFNFEEELGKLPHSPGVYIMHSSTEEILYVGKAVDLHNRVRQYFRKGHGHNGSLKIAKMVSLISYFEYIVTSSEMEALVLESNLISLSVLVCITRSVSVLLHVQGLSLRKNMESRLNQPCIS